MQALIMIMCTSCIRGYLLFHWNFVYFSEFRSLVLCLPPLVLSSRTSSARLNCGLRRSLTRTYIALSELTGPPSSKSMGRGKLQPSHLHTRPTPGLRINLNILESRIRGTGSIPQQNTALRRIIGKIERAIGLACGMSFATCYLKDVGLIK